MNKEAISGVMYGITVAKGIIGVAMDELEDCGLRDYERGKTKECLRKGMRLLEIAYDIVDCAED